MTELSLKPGLPLLIQSLSQPDIYPDPTTRVELRQTQMSCVFLTDNFVYKIKKPVNLGYVDYTSLDKRRFYCEREVQLNQRLCRQGYLGVIPITLDNHRLAIDGCGDVVEYAVKMLRLPAELMLDNLLLQNKATSEMMVRIARKVASFHSQAETSSDIARFGSVEAINHNNEENFDQIEKYVGKCISGQQLGKIQTYTRSFIQNNSNLLADRVHRGMIRDCHGDLHAAHICLSQDICIYDCIEFNERFRYGDVASEVAFLAMDLDHYGHADLSRSFLKEYVSQSQDKDLLRLVNFYKCYRAFVRGKVACFKLDDPYITEEDRQYSQATAEEYFDLAHSYTRSRPVLVITTGLTGCGKSTVAAALARRSGLVHISSDITRKKLAGIPENEHRFDEPASGIYSSEFTHKTYETMLEQAGDLLEEGYSVVLDAAFLKRNERLQAYMLAQKANAVFCVVECRLDTELARKRLSMRLEGPCVSDGRWEIYLKQQEWFEPVTEFDSDNIVTIDTSMALGQNVKHILTRVEKLYA